MQRHFHVGCGAKHLHCRQDVQRVVAGDATGHKVGPTGDRIANEAQVLEVATVDAEHHLVHLNFLRIKPLQAKVCRKLATLHVVGGCSVTGVGRLVAGRLSKASQGPVARVFVN